MKRIYRTKYSTDPFKEGEIVVTKTNPWPYWPARVLQKTNNKVEVVFIGEGSKEWLRPHKNQVFKMTEKRSMIDESFPGVKLAMGEVRKMWNK